MGRAAGNRNRSCYVTETETETARSRDHCLPDLIWNQETRADLRKALEEEVAMRYSCRAYRTLLEYCLTYLPAHDLGGGDAVPT